MSQGKPAGTISKETPERRWHQRLALSYLRRADQSANYLRALLFALSSSAVGFILYRSRDELRFVEMLAVLSFAVAIGLIVWSWDVQKHKASQRFKYLRDAKYADYEESNRKIEGQWFGRNVDIDRLSYIFILLGFAMALVAKVRWAGIW